MHHLSQYSHSWWTTSLSWDLLYWHQLNKKGHSSEKERQSLREEAVALYNLKGKIVVADREYSGEQWLAFLSQSGIDFDRQTLLRFGFIRMSETCYKIPISQATSAAYSKLGEPIYKRMRSKQALKRKRGVIKSFLLNGCLFSVVLLKNPKSELQESIFYFVSSLTNKVHSTEAYRIRWKIEKWTPDQASGPKMKSYFRSGLRSVLNI